MASLFNPLAWFPMTSYMQGPAYMPQEWINNAPVDNRPYTPAPHVPSAYELSLQKFNEFIARPQGLNPGLMQAVPIYNGNDPRMVRYNWGSQPFQSGTTFNANLAKQSIPVATAPRPSPFAAVTTTVPRPQMPAPKAVQSAPLAKR